MMPSTRRSDTGLLLAGFRFTPHQHRPQHRAGKLKCFFLMGKGDLADFDIRTDNKL